MGHAQASCAAEAPFGPHNARQRSWRIFQHIAALERCRPSRASLLADQMEEVIRDRSLRPNQSLGTESELAARFEVGRRMVRQAGRILSARGMIDVRRGKAGGFLVSAPSQGVALASLGAAVGPRQQSAAMWVQARAGLAPYLSWSSGAAQRLVTASLKPGGLDGEMVLPGLGVDVRAQRLASAMLSAGMEAGGPPRIGSLGELAERFNSGLPVVVQAIRVLEDMGFVTSARGRRGGILINPAGPAAAVRLVNAHLTSEQVAIAECDALVRGINLATLRLVRASRLGGRADALRQGLAAMEAARTPGEVGLRWFMLQRTFSELAANPLLHMLVRSLAAYVVLRPVRGAELTDGQARELIACTRIIVAETIEGSGTASDEAHLRCQDVLRLSW